MSSSYLTSTPRRGKHRPTADFNDIFNWTRERSGFLDDSALLFTQDSLETMDTRVLRHPARRKDKVSVPGIPGMVDNHGKPSDGAHLVPITFPATRTALWDPRRTGEPFHLHPAYYRNPVIVVEERPLRLAQRLAHNQSEESFTCTLHGSLSVDPDGEGVRILLDRLDTASIDVVMPCELSLLTKVSKNTAKTGPCSAEAFSTLIRGLQNRCATKDKVDLNHFVTLQASTSYCSNSDSHVFYMDLDAILPAISFKATPINSIPIVPTALSKNLSGPLNMSDVQGEPKSGYLTMDHTRKLLLVLESDPKVSTLPLIGIWVSGVVMVHDPMVWASSIRYLYNATIQDRVCKPPEPFLVVLYSPLHSKPEFYECLPGDGRSALSFSLYTCHEVIKLPKDYPDRPQSPLELELTLVENGSKCTVFEAALESTKNFKMANLSESSLPADHLAGSMEEIMPRSIPRPHRGKMSMVEPSVPEVSLLFDENERLVEPKSQKPQPALTPTAVANKQQPKRKDSDAGGDQGRGPLKTLNQARGPKKAASKVSPAVTSHMQLMSHPSPYTPPGSVPYPPTSVSSSPHLPPSTMTYHPQLGYIQNGSYGTPPYPVQNVVPPNATWPQYTPPYPLPPGAPYPGYPANSWPQAMEPRPHHPQYMMPPQSMASPSMPFNGYVPHSLPEVPQYGSRHPSVPAVPANQMPAGHQQPTSRPANSSSVPASSQRGIMPPLPATPAHEKSGNSGVMSGGMGPTNVKLSASTAQPVMSPAGSTKKKYPVQPEGEAVARTPSSCQVEHHEPEVPTSEIRSTPVSLPSEALPEVYELLRQKDVQLDALRQQLDQLLSRQNEPPKSPVVTSHAPTVTASRQVCTTAVNTSFQWQEEASSHHPSRVQPVHSQGEPQQSRRSFHSRSLAKSHPPHCHSSPPSQNSTPAVHSNPNSPQHLPYRNPVQCCHSSPEQPESDLGQRLSAESLCLGEMQLKQIQDRTSDSLSSDMVVDMPEYGSLSPDKSALQSSSGFNDTERSPVLGESVSFYQNQLNEQTVYTRRQGEESADTGLGDSHPDVDLLLSNHRLFYQNLIGNVKKFLASHDESTMDVDIQSTGHVPQSGGMLHMSHNQPESPAYLGGNPAEEPQLVISNQQELAQQMHNRLNEFNRSGETIHQNDEQQRPVHNITQNTKDNMEYFNPQEASGNPLDASYGNGMHDGDVKNQMHSTQKTLNASSKHMYAEVEQEEEEEGVDVAEETRRQLERMGIYLDNLVDQDVLSKEDKSLFFDPAMLPKLNYVSMMWSDDSDLSADADALAMKYLGDNQLAELAKLRLHSPQTKTRQDAALKHIMSASSETPNVSTFGHPSNHMSFASKKFLEKYGLAGGASPNKTRNPQTPDTPTGIHGADSKAQPETMNVRQFLKQLADQSLNMSTPCNQRHLDDSSCKVSRAHDGNQSVSGSYRDLCHQPRQDHRSVCSDTTVYHTPSRSPKHRHDNVTDTSRHQKASSDHTPIRVFDNDFRDRMRQHNPKNDSTDKIEYGKFLGEIPQDITQDTSSSSANKAPKRILDIKRLRELPKLL